MMNDERVLHAHLNDDWKIIAPNTEPTLLLLRWPPVSCRSKVSALPPQVLTMFCQALRITLSSSSCLDLVLSPCVSRHGHFLEGKRLIPIKRARSTRSERHSVPDADRSHLGGGCRHGRPRSECELSVAAHRSGSIAAQRNTHRPVTSPRPLPAAPGCIFAGSQSSQTPTPLPTPTLPATTLLFVARRQLEQCREVPQA